MYRKIKIFIINIKIIITKNMPKIFFYIYIYIYHFLTNFLQFCFSNVYLFAGDWLTWIED